MRNAGSAKSMASGRSKPPPKVLDGSALYGRAKTYGGAGALEAMPLLAVEAEADRLRICSTLQAAFCRAAASDATAPAADASEPHADANTPASPAPAEGATAVVPEPAQGEPAQPGAQAGEHAVPQAEAGEQALPAVQPEAAAPSPAGTPAKVPGSKRDSRDSVAKPAADAPAAAKPAAAAKDAGKSKSGTAAAKALALQKYAKVLAKYAQPPEVTCGRYVCDLGNVVKGLQASKRIAVQNTSSQAVQLTVDKALLEAYGSSLAPDKSQKLAGAPDYGTVELTLAMNTNLSHVIPGPVQFDVPLAIKNGPPAMVTVRADVVVPEVTCSRMSLDFGAVQWGMAKVIVVRLANAKAVPAEWAFRKPLESAQAVNWDHYRCEPKGGVVAPHSHVDVKVFFVPEHPSSHADDYPQELPLRVANNPHVTTLTLKGSGVLHKARITPKELDLGAVLPTSAGAAVAPISADFTIRNRNDAPIEVVALDFDDRVAEEEALLAEWQGYQEELGYALLPPRPPGAPFWPEITAGLAAQCDAAAKAAQEEAVRAAAAAAAAEAAAIAAPAADAAAADPAAQAADAPGAKAAGKPAARKPAAEKSAAGKPASGKPAGAPAEAAESAEAVPDAEAAVPEPAEATEPSVPEPAASPPAPVFAMVASFAAEEEAEQSARFAARYGVPVATFTDLILDAGDLEAEHEGEAFEGGKRTFGDCLYEELIGWQREGDDESAAPPPRPYRSLPAEKLEPLVARALRAALQQPCYARGCIIQGLRCEFAPAGAAVRALIEHLGLEVSAVPAAAGSDAGAATVWTGANKFWFVPLDMSVEDAEARRRAQLTPEQLDAEAAVAAAAAAPSAKGKTPPKKAAAPAKGKKGAAVEEEKAPVIPEGINPELGARYFEHDGALRAVRAALLAEHPESAVRVRSAQLGAACVDSAALHDAITGARFEYDRFECVMPPAEADKQLVAPPYVLQVVRKPAPRKPRKAGELFKLLAVQPADPAAADAARAAAATPPKGASKPTANSKKDEAVAPPAPPEPAERTVEQSRWVLAPGEAATARLQFTSAEVTDVDTKIGFEVYSGESKIEVPVRATCAHPSISADPKDVFARRVRVRPGSAGDAAIRRQYVTNRKRFEFGPLLVGTAPVGEGAPRPAEHSAVFCIKNDGRFDVNATLAIKSAYRAPTRVDAALAAGGKGAKAPAKPPAQGGKSAAEEAPPSGPFTVEPTTLALKVGETGEVTVWCFPTDAGEVQDALLCMVENKPEPVEFPMAAFGTVPAVTVRLDGDEPPPAQTEGEGQDGTAAAAAAALAAGAEPQSPPKGKGVRAKGSDATAAPARPANKLLDEGVVFSRLVPGRKEMRSFKVTNTSRLPVSWALAPPQKVPVEFSFHSKDDKGRYKRLGTVGGTLKALESALVHVEFASQPLEGDALAKHAKAVEAELKLEVRDGRKSVAQTKAIRLRGETYTVGADVAYAGGGDCVNFGKLRVRSCNVC
jgi:hypothetical protein